ncbi:helix-turn-helix domain-containing protein [Asticcacaulis endophyticus]|uniref:HTH cro/C1-type domain-containing protein n=1 Tax=Asticcacaulis endophyticus TaxID=1395890 RepID=A0A918UTP5_9CAUL|nr:helix-turn-helix transcriptional regulator [Asticcacaulis endophyticus]GGZ32396.1 hypothetical protein GCM10011273_18170 [Asticcacaulis endophyticus]
MAKNPLEIEFGKIVIERRNAQGWSQDDLAEKSGLSRNTIGRIERAETSITTNNITALAKSFGVDPVFLFRRGGPNDPMLTPLASTVVSRILKFSHDDIEWLNDLFKLLEKKMP